MGVSIYTRLSGFCVFSFVAAVMVVGCAKNDETPPAALASTIVSGQSASGDVFSPDNHDWPQETSDLLADPRVKYGRLKNGLRYAVLPMQDKNNVSSVQLNISAGFNQEPENVYGVAHLLEHIAFRGKRGGDETSIIHNLQASGVGYGSDFNGYTQPDNTYYRLNLGSGNSQDIDAALQSMRVLVDLPELTVENMQAEKRVVLAELRRRDSVQSRAAQSYQAFANPGQPRDTVSGIGTVESLEAISLQDLKTFKDTHYVPDKALLIIAGDVDFSKTKSLIRKRFSNWSPGPLAPRNINVPPMLPTAYPSEDVSYVASQTKRQLNAIEHRLPTWRPDSFDSRKRAFAEHRVTSMLETRLDRRVETENRVSWIKLVRQRTAEHNIDGVKLSATHLPLAMTIFEEERRRAVKFGFTAKDLQYELTKQRAFFERVAASSEAGDAWREANALRTQFTKGLVYQNAKQDLDMFDKISAELALEEYNRVAREVWTDFNPKYWSQSDRPISGIVKAVKAARARVNDADLSQPVAWIDTQYEKARFEGSGKIKDRDLYRPENVQRLLFENGVRLNYKVNEEVADDIKIAVFLRQVEPEFIHKNYAAIAEKVAAISRADILDTDAISMDRQFVGKQANFSLQVIDDRLVLRASTTPEFLRESLDLISTFLVKFDPKSTDFQRSFKTQIKQVKNSSRRSPATKGVRDLTFAYSGQANAYKSESINRPVIASKVEAQIDSILKTGSVEVGVVGDFEADVLERIFAATLGAMPNRPDVVRGAPRQNEDVTLIEPGLTTLTYNGTADQMALFYCWPEDALADVKDRSEMDLLSDIFRNRLLNDLRNERGVTYSPQIMRQRNRAFPELGFLCLYAQVDPKNETAAHDGFQNVIASFQDNPITALELQRVREPLLSRYQRYGASNVQDAIFAAISFSEPQAWETFKLHSKAISKVKLKTLNRRVSDAYDTSNLHIFRVQHYQSSRAVKENTLRVKSYLGDTQAQFLLGKEYLNSLDTEKIARGAELLKRAGEGGERDAYFRLGQYHLGKPSPTKEDLRLGASALELSLPSVDASFRLGEIYFQHYAVFPDVEDTRIMRLLTDGAQGGNWRAQEVLAERLKDGTMTMRDEIGALKWALISNHTRSGELSIKGERGIKRFITGLPSADVKLAQAQARAWVEENPNK